MRYALRAGKRVEATPGTSGLCPGCGAGLVAKCGKHVAWHWAHQGRRHCDIWWERETDWHRTWKNRFPVEWQEVVQFDPTSGEKHIADVKTASGRVIEFQHSSIHPDEVAARERFYQPMIWVVDGLKNELDKYYFRLGLGRQIGHDPIQYSIRWWGQSKFLANWSRAYHPVYLDFGNEDIIWKLVNFDTALKEGVVVPASPTQLVRLWIEGVPS